MLLTFSFQIMSNVKVDPLDNGGNQERPLTNTCHLIKFPTDYVPESITCAS